MSLPEQTANTASGGDAPTSALCVLLYDDATTKELGAWAEKLLVERLGRIPWRIAAVPEAAFADKARELAGAAADAGAAVVIVLLFWDGQAAPSKDVFMVFRDWATRQKNVAVQALNAKKGAHTLDENADAVVASVAKKLPAALLAEGAGGAAAAAGGTGGAAAGGAGAGAAGAAADEAAAPKAEELSLERLTQRMHDGQGECFWLVHAPTDEFENAVKQLSKVAADAGASIFPVMQTPKPVPKDGAPAMAQEFMVRRASPDTHIEMRMAMCGNVDSGKSTLTSVLTRGFRDDGRGYARSFVFNHKHEADTGRTSSISENHLGFDSCGGVVNYPSGGPANAKHTLTAHEMFTRSGKMVTLYDLAGHEKYLKTTVLGMTRSVPDYACIVISANNGIQRMTKEHLGLCLALKLPFFIVVTRIDATPDNVRQETLQTIVKLLKLPTVKKLPYPVRKPDDVVVCAKNLKADRICPIFEVSNVAMTGIPELLTFINLLPIRKDWNVAMKQPKEMIIDSTFFVSGVGTVVGGIVTKGTFRPNDTVLIGPDGLGHFRPTQIKSIHVKGVEVPVVEAGNDAALCLKKEKRSAIRKGNVLVDVSTKPQAHWQFEGEIVILYHSTTISTNYEPVIHSQTVRQSARILLVDQEVLRTGDRAIVRFHFLHRPEYIQVGQTLIFREGRTKGIGTITKLVDGIDANFMSSTRQKLKEAVRSKHTDPTAAAAAPGGGGGAAAGGSGSAGVSPADVKSPSKDGK